MHTTNYNTIKCIRFKSSSFVASSNTETPAGQHKRLVYKSSIKQVTFKTALKNVKWSSDFNRSRQIIPYSRRRNAKSARCSYILDTASQSIRSQEQHDKRQPTQLSPLQREHWVQRTQLCPSQHVDWVQRRVQGNQPITSEQYWQIKVDIIWLPYIDLLIVSLFVA